MENMHQNVIDPTIQYDVVELPSRGILYPSKIKAVKVAYLTASDENVLTSPNLVASGNVIDELLKRKILTKELPINELTSEDRQAILIFLRNTAFGSELKMNVRDPKTDELFEHIVDLSVLTYKDFDLQEDENGNYPYYMEKSKTNITFNFLKQKDEEELDLIAKNWNGLGTAPIITKRLEKLIKTVEGNPDPMNIRNFVEKLPILDSQNFRKYVNKMKPGVDLAQTVIAPSGEKVTFNIDFGVDFFRPFYGV